MNTVHVHDSLAYVCAHDSPDTDDLSTTPAIIVVDRSVTRSRAKIHLLKYRKRKSVSHTQYGSVYNVRPCLQRVPDAVFIAIIKNGTGEIAGTVRATK